MSYNLCIRLLSQTQGVSCRTKMRVVPSRPLSTGRRAAHLNRAEGLGQQIFQVGSTYGEAGPLVVLFQDLHKACVGKYAPVDKEQQLSVQVDSVCQCLHEHICPVSFAGGSGATGG